MVSLRAGCVTILLPILIILFGGVTMVFAFDDEVSRRSLQGFQGVYVFVEDIDPDTERDGLTKAQIQTLVGLRLRKAGIMILSREEYLKMIGASYLYIKVYTKRHENGRDYSYAIQVSLNQDVALSRNPKIKVEASTWNVGTTGHARKDNFIEARRSISDLVDRFVIAYLAMNPND